MPTKTKRKIAWLLFLFLAFNILWKVDGGGNPASRLATLAALSENQSFAIDRYVAPQVTQSWTADWAEAPSGKYYSNKAPGPALLAFPVYYVWDHFLFRQSTPKERDQARWSLLEWSGYFLGLLTQVLPMALLLLLLSWILYSRGLSERSLFLLWFLVGFANTNALLMNTFFGHGMTAFWILAACASSLFYAGERRYMLTGLCWALALLCDYSVALAFPLVTLSMCVGAKSWREALRRLLFLGLGGLLPGGLWCYYHSSAFGSPFVIALHFQNPVFAGPGGSEPSLSRVIGWLPDADILWRLIKGSSRGLLMTQAWVLILLPLMLRQILSRRVHSNKLFLAGSLVFFGANLWMNAAFPNWWGGASPGPRYLGPSLIPLALSSVLIFDEWSERIKGLFSLFVLPSLVLYALAMSQKILIDNTPLWRDLLYQLTGTGPYTRLDVIILLKFSVALVALVGGFGFFMLPPKKRGP